MTQDEIYTLALLLKDKIPTLTLKSTEKDMVRACIINGVTDNILKLIRDYNNGNVPEEYIISLKERNK